MTIRTSYAPGEPTWVDVSTPDVDATVAFYGALFGWEADRSRAAEFGGYANFTKDGKKVAGVLPLMQEGMPPVWSCYVATDDAEKTAALVAENGGTVVAPPMAVQELGVMSVFTSPEGAFFGAWQAGTHLGAERVFEEGCLQWVELSSHDAAGAPTFYRNVFGWDVEANPGYTELKVDGTSVAGCLQQPDDVPAGTPPYWMPYFCAQDPAAKAQEAAGLGATVLVPYLEMADVAFSVVADPHGAVFGLLRVDS